MKNWSLRLVALDEFSQVCLKRETFYFGIFFGGYRREKYRVGACGPGAGPAFDVTNRGDLL